MNEITKLLRVIGPHVDWLIIGPLNQFEMLVDGQWKQFIPHKKLLQSEANNLLGAICADIEARGWDWCLASGNTTYEAVVYKSGNQEDEYIGVSTDSIIHAALLALIKALGAEGENLRCEACLGTGKQDHFGYGTFPCSDCHGTTAREVGS